MGYLSDYIAAKDAERADGSVDWSQVPARNGGYLVTNHPDDHADPTWPPTGVTGGTT